MNYFITTSLPYVNSELHVGHAMEFVMADVLARYHRLQGDTVLFSTGTDEHGSKIAEKAKELGKEPKAHADEMVEKAKALQTNLQISNDRFIRTTDEAHEQRTQIIWEKLKPYIYKDKYVGLYCTGCEAFISEADAKVNNGICPDHNKPYEKIEEENYFFRLSNFADQIKQAIETDTFKVVPQTRKNEVLGLFKSGMEDISISRPTNKVSWGIPVPDDPNHVMYVWFEALLNYITVLGYPEHQDFKDYWPANVQVIGKNVIRFHAVIWPGILLGLGVELPKQLYVHGFVNIDGKKMSKSLGNSVFPQQIIDKYGSDGFRYYFLRHIPSYEDGSFSWDKFEEAYNNELANELGNAVQRTAAMVIKYQKGVVGNTPEAGHDINQYTEAIENCRFDKALDEVWEQVRGLNQYIDEQKPWAMAKENDFGHLQEVLAYMVACLMEIAELLEPLLPTASANIKHIVGKGIIQPMATTMFPKQELKTTE